MVYAHGVNIDIQNCDRAHDVFLASCSMSRRPFPQLIIPLLIPKYRMSIMIEFEIGITCMGHDTTHLVCIADISRHSHNKYRLH